MILPWKNYLGENNEVSFETPDGVKYIAYPNSEKYILKIDNGSSIKIYETEWEEEKVNLSNNYSDIYGVYEPCKHEDLDEDDDKVCYFGKTSSGLYLDRIQRPEYVMNHDMTSLILNKDGWGILHTPDGGKTFWKTEWCDRLGEYYNCMRCDVFPDNPGWQPITKEEAIEVIRTHYTPASDIEEVLTKLENHQWKLPAWDTDKIIGNWLIP